MYDTIIENISKITLDYEVILVDDFTLRVKIIFWPYGVYACVSLGMAWCKTLLLLCILVLSYLFSWVSIKFVKIKIKRFLPLDGLAVSKKRHDNVAKRNNATAM